MEICKLGMVSSMDFCIQEMENSMESCSLMECSMENCISEMKSSMEIYKLKMGNSTESRTQKTVSS